MTREDPHVVVVGNYLPDGQKSMQRFADIICNSLRQRGVSMESLRPAPVLSRLVPRTSGLRKWIDYVDKFLIFPQRLSSYISHLSHAMRRRAVVHICDHSNSFYVDSVEGVRNLVTCHDMIAVRQAQGRLPGPPVRWTGQKLQQIIVRGLRRADWIACDSNNTRTDLLSCCRRDVLRTTTIHCQLNHHYTHLAADFAWRVLGPKLQRWHGATILHVGNNSWYKNRDGVLRIFAKAKRLAIEVRPRLVVVGGEFTPAQNSFIVREGLVEVVQRISDVSATELQAAYSLADVFLFPSFYEGFGWPPVEAQACGCPVVAGIGGSLAEILEDSALTASVDDEHKIAWYVSRVLLRKEERERLRVLGLANARRFQPPAMAEKYLEMYYRIIGDVENCLPVVRQPPF